MRFTGTLDTWNDERGFGFIEPTQGGQRLFVHIKDFPSGSGRPSVGQVLSFEVEASARGKKARSVQYPPQARRAPRPRTEAPARWTLPRLLALPLFIGLYAGVVVRWGWSPPVLLAYGISSAVTFMAYALDKSAAVSGGWRTSERTLHLLALACGWPGALVAQQMLRHKTSKPSFVAAFWFTVVLNVLALILWHAGRSSWPRLAG